MKKSKRTANVVINQAIELQQGKALTVECRENGEYLCRLEIGRAGIDAWIGKKCIGKWAWEGVMERLNDENAIKHSS